MLSEYLLSLSECVRLCVYLDFCMSVSRVSRMSVCLCVSSLSARLCSVSEMPEDDCVCSLHARRGAVLGCAWTSPSSPWTPLRPDCKASRASPRLGVSVASMQGFHLLPSALFPMVRNVLLVSVTTKTPQKDYLLTHRNKAYTWRASD